MMKNISHHDQDMSNLTSASNEAISASSTGGSSLFSPLYNFPAHHLINQTQPPLKKKRNQPGHPDPEAEVISLSPRSLLATNRFVCDVCHKGFQRDQNLQLHRRGHNLPWKLKQRSSAIIPRKKVYVCPETSCVHHDPSRALGDLTGVKKHFSRKHGEKKWKCDKCSKKYAVQSDWKAHSKICGTREYRCDCGTLFSRRDSFITHRAFCDALAQESAMRTTTSSDNIIVNTNDEYHRIPVKKEVLQAGFTAMSLKPPADFPLPLVPLDNIQPSVFHYFHQNPNPNVGPGTNHISATSSSPLPTYGHYYNNHDNINQPSSLYYDMMMMGSGESLEFHAALDEFRMSRNEVDDRGSVVEGGSGETTRDFLGLRGLSESDYMSIAGGLGFSSCMGTRNASTHNL